MKIRICPDALNSDSCIKEKSDILEVRVGFNKDNHPIAIAWRGKSAKHSFFYRYKTVKERDEFVDKWIADVKSEHEKDSAAKELVDNMNKALTADKHFQIGDIITSHWGYEQTNVDCYQVAEIKGKKIRLVEIGKELAESEGYSSMAGMFKPVKLPDDEAFKKEGKFHLVRFTQGGYIKICGFESFEFPQKWDGKPFYVSWYA